MDTKPTQAVILAGGRGVRLKPITDDIPKPMIHFHGKPFLRYLIENLKEEGFTKVLLLLGYLPERIQDYFGNGESFGIKIEYEITSPEDETGKRLKLATHKLDPHFLLMYCDNYWPMQFNKMWQQFQNQDSLAQITVYKNDDNYTKNNVLVDGNNYVVKYDKGRTDQNLRGVDIGFVLLKKEVLSLIPDKNVNFEAVVYPQLVRNNKLTAFLTHHRYYSVGSHERISDTERFLRRNRTIFIDRDGVLNKKAPKAEYITSIKDFIWLPEAKEALLLLKENHFNIIIVTNQAGVARGKMTQFDLDNIHNHMTNDLAKIGVKLDAIYCCTHGWDDGCFCRKPKPGMFFMAQKDFYLDLSKTDLIGDDERDQTAGEAAGIKTIILNQETTLLKTVKEIISKQQI